MAKHEVTVTAAYNGARLDKAIVALVDGASRARVKRAIEDGGVKVNGHHVVKGAVVSEGDVIAIEETAIGAGNEPCVPEPEAPLAVRHESAKVLVVDKPAGQPTAPIRAGETGTLANALVGHYPELSGFGYSPREPGIVHRLDNDTSGLVVVARSAAAFEVLKDALQFEKLGKEYLLVCASENLPDTGTIEYPIANHPKDKRRVYPCIHPRDVMRYAPRPAVTSWTVERRVGPWALVRASAPRAVRHQLRAHFAAIEHPLAGDTLYGAKDDSGLTRHALHAARISYDGEGDALLAFDVKSPLPPDMQALVQE
ncbi:MAG: Ribosomal large subunit pseudouridine synthase [Labilithrix sp.]|nr:Ribosomal large subunit pseudouridine synthase [Labilithrix sp.]